MSTVQPNSTRNLRQSAEEKLTPNRTSNPMVPSSAGNSKLLHELQVHQIELNMQNEELQQTIIELDSYKNKTIERSDELTRTITKLQQETDEHKQSVKLLDENRELLATLANQVPGVIYQFRLYADGRSAFPYSSPGMIDIYEVTPEEVQEDATPVYSRLHPDDYANVVSSIQESARTLHTFQCVFRVILPRQGLRWRKSRAQPERMPDGGTLWHGIILDITDLMLAEEALREKEATYGSLFMNILNSVVHTRIIFQGDMPIDMLYLSVNPAFAVVTGINESVVGRKISEVIPGYCENNPESLEIFGRVAVTMVPTRWEHYLREIDRWFSFIIYSPNYGEVIIVTENITDRKRAEEEKIQLEIQLQHSQKMEAVGRLAGGVAHDFNNMLSVILGHAELALMKIDPSHQLFSDLTEICQAAQRSSDLTRQLLAFARKQTIAPTVHDLNTIVSGLLKMLRRIIGEDINLDWRPEAHLWPIMVDPSQIDQIMANLCVNARDAITNNGTLIITTENTYLDEKYCTNHPGAFPGEYVLLAVSDNGCGIARETMDHIFEPFFTTKELGKGTGLGLATIFGIVKQNNGYIDVLSEPGIGTTFTIFLPKHVGNAVQPQKQGIAIPVPTGLETVLLVEDERAILNVTSKILNELGYQVLSANTPREALRLAQENAGKINLLISDVIMPEMNGKDLYHNLQSQFPQLKCLFMSGYTADTISRNGVIDEGFFFIQKP